MSPKYQFAVLFAIVCLVVSMLFNRVLFPTEPSEWYWSLNKSILHPPSYIFGPVWTMLYLSMGAGFGYLLAEFRKHSETIYLFCLQFILNLIWSPLFFGYHRMDVALMDLSLVWMLMLIIVFRTYSDRFLACAFIPYFLWLSYAWVLSASLIYLN